MKQAKKWLVLLLALILVLSISLAACKDTTKCECPDCGCETCEDCANCDCPACGGGKKDEITLVAPVISLKDNVISWSAVPNATRYIVYEGGQVASQINAPTTSYTINKSVAGSWEYKVAAYNVDANPKTGPQSNPVTYTYKPDDVGGDDHVCKHVCDVCHKCTDKLCQDPVCAEKCEGHDVVNPKLEAPTVDIAGNALNWHSVLNAVAYDVYKNGEKIDTIDSFEVTAGLNVLFTTYTIKNANDGDTFQVVAVSGSEDVDNSALSEEVTYSALGTTVSLTDSVYVTNGTNIKIPVSADSSNGLYKVIIKENNNFVLSTGLAGTDSIKVQGDPGNSKSPYGADAEYDVELGAWVATVVITGSNELRLDITATFDSVGYTVSLAEPYDLGEDSDKVIATYTLNATGSLDVEIPYVGYSIKINVGSDVAASHVLYVVLANGEENVGINANGTKLNERVGYYASNSLTGNTITLNNDNYIALKATISFEVPEAALANLPSLKENTPNYEANHIEHGANDASQVNPTQIRVDGITDGSYILVISAKISDGLNFFAKLDNGEYASLDHAGNIYSLNVTISDNKILSLYEFTSVSSNKEGIDVNWVALYTAGNKSYSMSNGEDVEDAFIGNSEDNATLFTLSGVEDGNYTLTLVGTSSGLSFKVGVGSNSYTVSTYENKYPLYIYTAEIAIEGNPENISIYCEKGVYIADLKIELIEEEELPELTHGADGGLKLDLTADGTEYKILLVDVEPGTYTLVFKTNSYVFWHSWLITAGENSITVGSVNGFSGAYDNEGSAEITIPSDCTELTMKVDNAPNNDFGTVTIYLLAEGESLEGGTGGTETSATINFNLNWMYGDQEVDVSSLQYGIYTITLEDVDDSLGSMVYLTTAVEGELLLNSDNNYSASITIKSGTIKLNGMGQSGEIIIKLVRTGDLPGASGGTDTELTIVFDNDSNVITSVFTNLDVSSLQYGEYTITLENVYKDFFSGYAPYSITVGEDEITLDEGNNWTATITINSDTISLFTTATYEPLTIKLVKNG